VAVTFRARVTRKGQVTIPRTVRQALGVAPGDEISFDVDPRGVTITPVHGASLFAPFEGRWRVGAGATADEIAACVREMRGQVED
jgi:antitoxin PrlF